MKLLEVSSETHHSTPGKATNAFMDYLSYMDDWMPDRALQQVKVLASSLIRQGFYFHSNDQFKDRARFTRDDMQVYLPSKDMPNKEMGKARIFLGTSLTPHVVSMSKAAKINYSQLLKAHEKLTDAEREMKALLS